MRRRHPSPLELGAYFDGEPVEGVSQHVARCRRCRESLEELHGVRSAVRGELDLTDGSARRRGRWTVALIPVAASVALLLAVAAPPGGLPVTRVQNADDAGLASAPPEHLAAPVEPQDVTAPPSPAVDAEPVGPAAPLATGGGKGGDTRAVRAGDGAAKAAASGSRTTDDAAPAVGAPSGKPAAGRAGAAAASAPASRPVPPPTGPLRLGVPVPTRGPSASEGDEVMRAVKAVVEQANDRGGVAGRRVSVVRVPTDVDADRVEALGKVDALVGGFAIEAPAGMPWIMPADMIPAGPDVAAGELAAERAGAALGAELATRSSHGGTIGAIVTAGPDAGLAAGLARARPVHTVEAGRGTSCDQEIFALRKREVAARALAVPPDLARRCAAAAARMGWRPAGGLLLAPSAVYAHLERDLVTQGARSAVALSMPNAEDPGSNRFRRSAPGCDSYRSLVSFAAAELALSAARASNGLLSVAAVRDRHWRSDLYEVAGGEHTRANVVSVRFGRWSNGGPHRGRSSPEPRRGVVLPDPMRSIVARPVSGA
jgi:hypothetical protein